MLKLSQDEYLSEVEKGEPVHFNLVELEQLQSFDLRALILLWLIFLVVFKMMILGYFLFSFFY